MGTSIEEAGAAGKESDNVGLRVELSWATLTGQRRGRQSNAPLPFNCIGEGRDEFRVGECRHAEWDQDPINLEEKAGGNLRV